MASFTPFPHTIHHQQKLHHHNLIGTPPATPQRQLPTLSTWRCHLLLLLLAVALIILPGHEVRGQPLPTRDEDHFRFQISHAELFYDTKLLPDGAEVTTYLHQGIWRKFFFMVEDGDTPVSLIVTPCASAIDWRLSLQDLPEGASGDRSDSDDLFGQSELHQEHTTYTGSNLLQTYSGSLRQTFTMADCPPGVLMLEIRARDQHTSVKMYTTTTPHSDHAYPLLPDDATLEITELNKHSVRLTWKPSLTSSQHGQPVQYCVVANKQGNFNTHCAAMAEVEGDVPPTAPPNSGFGFAWEREQRRQREKKATTALREARHRQAQRSRDDIVYECIGNKQAYTFSGLRAGQLYYFDVFAVNLITNRSTAYLGISAQTPVYEKTTTLKDGKVIQSHVKKSRGQKIYDFRPGAGAEEAVIAVQPCSGRLVVEISNEHGIIAHKSIRDLWKVTLRNVTHGPYLIRVAPKRHRSTSFKVFASTSPTRYPFPDLPDDTAIRVFDRQRTCNSMVIAWLGTNRRLQYCLYLHKLTPGAPLYTSGTLGGLFRQSNQCVRTSYRKKSDKVMCRYFRWSNPRRSVITETVRGLKPATRYVIDVYARRPGRETLSYQTAWASTRSEC